MNAPQKSVNKSGWKPTSPAQGAAKHGGPETTTGNYALMLEEKLIFDIGTTETTALICQRRRLARAIVWAA